MPRLARIDLPGGWYHITSRGNERRSIFRDDRDRSHFLELLAEMTTAYAVHVHAFVLMSNHYHFLLETPEANLSRAMHWFNVSYSVWFNRRRQRVGHFFQGRFKAIVVDAEGWALGLSQYLHLNPVRIARLGLDKQSQRLARAGLCDKPDAELVRERIARLRDYRWSSYRAYVGAEREPDWLHTERVLSLIGGDSTDRQRRLYRDAVEQMIGQGREPSPWEELEAGMVLGGSEFMNRIRSITRGREKQQPKFRRLKQRPGLAGVIELVEGLKGEDWPSFRDRHGDWGRDLVLYLGRKRCGMTLRELGLAVGGIGEGSVSMAVKRFKQHSWKDKRLLATIATTTPDRRDDPGSARPAWKDKRLLATIETASRQL